VTIAEQTVWQWIALVLWTLLAFSVIGWAIRQRWRTSAAVETEQRLLHKAALPAVLVVISVVFLREVIEQINLTGTVFLVAEAIGQSLRSTGIAWLIVLGCQAMAEFIVRSPSVRPGSLDAHLLRTGFRILGLTLALLLVSHTATQLGIPLLGVLAGLGVGGLAIALAAQPTIENFIGSVILFADRPVRVGEFCQCGDVLGTVEEIGLRSTRIRALDRTLVSIPNSEFSKARIINFTQRDRHLFEATVAVRFDATPNNLERLLACLRDELERHDLVVSGTVRVRFGQIREGAFEIGLRAYLQTTDVEVFLKEKEDLLLKVISVMEASGCAFATPVEDMFLKYSTAP
jgi:MscS family membrane protein